MKEKYQNNYYHDNVYGHVVELLSDLQLPEGVHLDIACGYAAIHTGMVENNLKLHYVGFDSDSVCIDANKANGLEVYQHEFGILNDDIEYIQSVLKNRKVVSISIIDALEHQQDPHNMLQLSHQLAIAFHAPLIVSVPNITHKDIAFKLLEGRFDYTETGLLDSTHLSLFTEKRLTDLLCEFGFAQIAANDVAMEQSDQYFPSDSTVLAKGSLAHQYLDWLKTSIDPNATINQFVRAYLPKEKAAAVVETRQERPFLTIITRTQGKRQEALTETLLCLTGQSNINFELLIIGHKLNHDQQLLVERIIEDCPEWMRQRTRLVKVDHGTRTTPLNIGFSEAKGEYIAILDDDDIVFDNWVEEFYQASIKHPGTILHAYTLSQDWMTVELNSGQESLRASGSPQNVFCKDFDFIDELVLNYCPPVGLAFPAYTFQKYKIQFDEALNTTEDWDFMMRTAFVSGVCDIDVPTCIYRLWTNSETSRTLHDQDEWEKNHLLIQNKFAKIPIVLPKGYSDQIIEERVGSRDAAHHIHTNIADTCVLYYDTGNGFSEKSVMDGKQSISSSSMVEFPEINKINAIHAIRIDPTGNGLIVLSDICVFIKTAKNDSFKYEIKNLETNGIKIGNAIVFLKSDPQFIIRFSEKQTIKTINVKYTLSDTIPDDLLEKAIAKYNQRDSIFHKVIRKLISLVKR